MIAQRVYVRFIGIVGMIGLSACGVEEENQDRRQPGLNYSADSSFVDVTQFQYSLPDRSNFGAFNVDPQQAIDSFYGSISSQEGCENELALSITRKYEDGWVFEAPLQGNCDYEIEVQIGSRTNAATGEETEPTNVLDQVYYRTVGKIQIKSEFYKGKASYTVELPLQVTEEGRTIGFL